MDILRVSLLVITLDTITIGIPKVRLYVTQGLLSGSVFTVHCHYPIRQLVRKPLSQNGTVPEFDKKKSLSPT